jgi:hypothetical protein
MAAAFPSAPSALLAAGAQAVSPLQQQLQPQQAQSDSTSVRQSPAPNLHQRLRSLQLDDDVQLELALALSHASEHDSAAEKAATAAACKEDEMKEAMRCSQIEAERKAEERKREEAELEHALKMSQAAPSAVPLLQVQRREMHACGLLTKQQLAALTYAAQRGGAMPLGSATSAFRQLQHRVTSLGFSADDLTRTSNFLRDEAPLLIHVHSNSLPSLLNDTHYRSGFERGTRLHCGNYVSRQWPLGDLPAS